jgi:two-component system sensor histidine kinase AlgZ
MAAPRRPWFPDFCRLPRIAAVLGITELVVVVVALAPTHAQRWTVDEFGAASAFALWLALTLSVTYCVSRPWVNRLPMPMALGLAMLLPLLVAAFGAWAVQQIDHGLGLGYTLPVAQQLRFVASVATLALLISLVTLRYFYVRDQWQDHVQARAKAQVEALQARIRPHFLFNSMNTIASLVRRQPAAAEQVVEDLSELFRAALGTGRDQSTLGEELHLAERYLAIEAQRFGERLRQRWEIAPDIPRDFPLPLLVLQPLVENAVVHGIARLPDGGEIVVRAGVEDGQLCLEVVNPSLPPRPDDAGNAHAQDSIAHRLAYQFGRGARMTAEYRDGYYRCELRLPMD